jgi:hypothetical protein
MAGWSQNTWNTGSWGTGVDNIVIPTGILATTAAGFLTTNSTVEEGWGRDQWGARAWGNPSQIVVPTTPEDDLTAFLGSVSITAEINAGWGAKNWGDNAWGIAGNLLATGFPLTGALGSPTIHIDVTATTSTNNGQLMTASLGTNTNIDIQTKVFPSGFPLTGALGTADAGPDAMATGIAMSMGLGTIEAFNQTGWGRQFWNVNAWGVEGQFANVDVTGVAMTAAVSAPQAVKGDANLQLNTLNVAQATLGNVDPAPDAMIIGQAMVANLGNAAGLAGAGADPTGLPMTATLASVTAVPSQEVNVTGIAMNAQLASVTAIIHVDVSVTGLGLTMAQGNGNALIWNEVNTGSAPIDPPGWQEVAA